MIRERLTAPRLACLILILAGLALRIAGVFNDLWLDEIWSLNAALGSRGFLNLFRIHSDNNHLLNTAYLYLVAGLDTDSIYRMLALLTGGLSLPLAYLIGQRRGIEEALVFLVFLSFSFLAVLYSSEARGYGPLVFAALASVECLERWLPSGERRWVLYFWAACLIGLLAHFSFFYFFLGLAAWSLAAGAQNRVRVVKLLAVPAVAALALYLSFFRFVPAGTGNLLPYFEVLVDAVSLSFGGPQLSPYRPDLAGFTLCLAAAVLYLTIGELFILRRARDPRWLFFFVVLFDAPLMILVLHQPRVLFPRYFLVSSLAGYLLLAGFVARLVRISSVGRVLASSLILLFLVGNGVYLVRLMKFGRGEYRRALSFIVAASRSTPITVSSDQDFRNGVVIDYHKERIPGGRKIHYIKRELAEQESPEWYISHSQDPFFSPPQFESLGPRTSFRLLRRFRFGAESGWNWFIYHRE